MGSLQGLMHSRELRQFPLHHQYQGDLADPVVNIVHMHVLMEVMQLCILIYLCIIYYHTYICIMYIITYLGKYVCRCTHIYCKYTC